MTICYMLVGLPASGKSTFVEKMLIENPDLPIISMDKYIEKAAKDNNVDYNTIFRNRDLMKSLEKLFKKEITETLNKKIPFIWDQMNITIESRRSKIARLKNEHYEIIAFEFNLPHDEWKKRIKNREINQPTKIFAKGFYEEIAKSFEEVKSDENFNDVYLVTIDGELQKKFLNNTCKKLK